MSEEVELRIAWASIAPARSDRADSRSAHTRSDEVFEDLVGRHRQPHRRYHGLRHVVWVLRHTRRLEAAIPECQGGSTPYDGAAVTAAACFHDAVYDPRADDNEPRSAVLAANQLASLGWPPQRCELVSGLILATARHMSDDQLDDGLGGWQNGRQGDAKSGGGDPSGGRGMLERAVLLDADLGVLGADPAAYAAYVTGVRAEYGHLTPEHWVAGRSAVLRGLLGRTHLYVTAPAREWWEERARANLVAELAGLSQRSEHAGHLHPPE